MHSILKEKKWIFVYLAFSLLLTVLQLVNPILISKFFDKADVSDVYYLLGIVALILIASIITGFLNIFCSILDTKVKNKIVRQAKKDYLIRLLSMDYEILEKIEFGEKKVRYDQNSVYGELATAFVSNTMIEIFTCMFIFLYLLTINYIMTAIFIFCLLINSFLEYQIGKKSYKFSKEVTELHSLCETKISNALRNIAYIKTNNCAKAIVDNIDHLQMNISKREEQHTKEVSWIDNLNLQIYKMIEVLIFAIAAFMLKNNTITVGQIYLFINYMGWIDNAFSTIWNNYIKYKSAKAKIDKIESTFANQSSLKKIKNSTINWHNDTNSLTINNICFKYKLGNFELKGINLLLHRGDFVAIVGESGCGKSTFMKLLSGLYHPNDGSILLNDTDITYSTPEQRANKLSYVSQNIAIMDDKLCDIVDFLNLGLSEITINNALRVANLSSFVEELKDGINTYISETNINLSGGQLQRLAVAQAMVYDKEIYIFDEITSGLDDGTQNKLIENLKKISKDKIMIFVTHRLNTLRHFNKVFEIENGTLKQISGE